MGKDRLLKVVVFVPASHEVVVRQAIEKIGGGKVGNYCGWTFSSKGVTRVMPLPGAHPALGEIGKIETIDEVRVETTCYESELDKLVDKIRKIHPYEQVPIDVLEIREL